MDIILMLFITILLIMLKIVCAAYQRMCEGAALSLGKPYW